MADPVETLGAFPIIQLAVAAVIGIGGAVAVWRGVASKPKRASNDGVEWFFDGPIAKVLETLQGIYRELKQQREDNARHADENNKKLDEQTGVLREIKDRMIDGARRPQRRG